MTTLIIMRRRLSLSGPLLLAIGLSQAAGLDLTGTVRDNLGAGLSNLTVQANFTDAFNQSTQAVTLTDATGRYILTGVENYWTLEVTASELNARGYLSVSGRSGNTSATNDFVTRRLDFTHRLSGLLVDESSQPLPGHTLRAWIVENNSRFETNLVSDATGRFELAATPALWTFCCLEAPPGQPARVFGNQLTEVALAQPVTTVTLTAPAVTSTLRVAATNLGGFTIVAESEANGTPHRLVQPAPWFGSGPLDFAVMHGNWRVVATNENSSGLVRVVIPPEPVLVAVSNPVVTVSLAGTPVPSPTPHRLHIRLITSDGITVSNASVALSGNPALPPLPGTQPGVYTLDLPAGRSVIRASTATAPDWIGWSIWMPVVIQSNPPPDITLVVPAPGQGPRLHGSLREAGGPPRAGAYVGLQSQNGITNLSITLPTDSEGRFGTNVPPGLWLVSTPINFERLLSSNVVVSSLDQEVNFEFLEPPTATAVPASVQVVDESGVPADVEAVGLASGQDFIHALPNTGEFVGLRPGIWSGYLQSASFVGSTPGYRLDPSVRWHVLAGDASTQLTLVRPRASARIEGRLRDEQGRLLQSGAAAAWTSVNGTNYWAYGSIASGYFSLNVFPGVWQVGAGVSRYPDVGPPSWLSRPISPGQMALSIHHSLPEPRFLQVTSPVTRCEFISTNVVGNVTLAVTLIREDGSPVEGARIVVENPGVDTPTALMTTDAAGQALLTTAPGAQSISTAVGLDAFMPAPLLWPSVRVLAQAPSNHVRLILRQPGTCLPGFITNATQFGVQPLVRGTMEQDGTNYSLTTCADAQGRFCLPVVPGTWQVVPALGSFLDHGIQAIAPRTVVVPAAGPMPSVEFGLQPLPGDFRNARLTPPVPQPDGRWRLQLIQDTSAGWQIERSTNLRDWSAIGLHRTEERTVNIPDPAPPVGGPAFYRARWVW